MEQLPASLAVVTLVLLGAVGAARRFDRRSVVADVVACVAVAALIVAAAATFPGDLLTAIGMMALIIGALGALVAVCAALEALPGLVRDRVVRSSSRPVPAPESRPRPLADAPRRSAVARP
jgi:membrane associated rhomboid family serine protease